MRFLLYLFVFHRRTFSYISLTLRNEKSDNVNITKIHKDVEAFRAGVLQNRAYMHFVVQK